MHRCTLHLLTVFWWSLLPLWSGDRRLVACGVHTDPMVTETGREGPEIGQRFDVGPGSPSAHGSPGAPKRDGTEAKVRRRRGWVFPGTLWCGLGSRAADYNQLGMFEKADRCCREHDHCLHIIPAFKVNYGVFNSNFFTVSHCDCDQRFRQCLAGVNDSIANMVGYSFFNIIKVPCFELKQQIRCTEMHWWGGCKLNKDAPNAVFKNPLPYNVSDTTSKREDSENVSDPIESSGGQNVTERPPINRTSSHHKHRCSTRHPPRGDNFHIRRKKGKGCERHREPHAEAPSKTPPLSTTHTPTPPMKKGLLNASTSSALMSNKSENSKTGLLASPTPTSKVLPQVTTSPSPRKTSTHSNRFFTQKPTSPLNLTTFPAIIKTTKSQTKGHSGVSSPHCSNCSGEKTSTPSTNHGAPITMTTLEVLRPKNASGTPRPNTLTTTPAAQITTRPQTPASTHEHNKTRERMDSQQPHNNTSHARNIHPRRRLTDNYTLCGSLKLLDECRYKIPPMEKKYELQNPESKTSYHCDCTTRLALRIVSSTQARTLPKLLMDFVAQHCFTLPKKKKCHSRKRCSGGFTKASDLLLVLKKIEEKDAAGVRNSGSERKRGIPVRLYKRCLRLEREADMMAQLTRL